MRGSERMAAERLFKETEGQMGPGDEMPVPREVGRVKAASQVRRTGAGGRGSAGEHARSLTAGRWHRRWHLLIKSSLWVGCYDYFNSPSAGQPNFPALCAGLSHRCTQSLRCGRTPLPAEACPRRAPQTSPAPPGEDSVAGPGRPCGATRGHNARTTFPRIPCPAAILAAGGRWLPGVGWRC